ncbi:hypothetical protein GW17_00002403 [Ensete ventricosum]|nr:hypothetical protein GW17_00002403 [Ensete ventricosum]
MEVPRTPQIGGLGRVRRAAGKRLLNRRCRACERILRRGRKRKREGKEGHETIGVEVPAGTGAVRSERCAELPRPLRRATSTRPQPRRKQESPRKQEGDRQAPGTPPRSDQPVRGLHVYSLSPSLFFLISTCPVTPHGRFDLWRSGF